MWVRFCFSMADTQKQLKAAVALRGMRFSKPEDPSANETLQPTQRPYRVGREGGGEILTAVRGGAQAGHCPREAVNSGQPGQQTSTSDQQSSSGGKTTSALI